MIFRRTEHASWPARVWFVRHGESAGNVARDAAEAAGHPRIDIAERDMDVPLSSLGERQAAALGAWFAKTAADERPTVVLASPYLRARRTAELAVAAAGTANVACVLDERLREREFGILDGLTRRGIVEMYPVESERRSRLGKFYHRPPGGESWCDVFLRLRSVCESLARDYATERVLVVAHQVAVLGFRYLLESMTEEEILAIDRAGDIANCSVTSYGFDGAQPRLELFNFISPVEDAGERVTSRKDASVAPK